MSASDGSNSRGGEEAAMGRATRRSGIEPDIDLWGLEDLPKSSTAKKIPARKGYTIQVDRKGRNKDIWKLRREATVNDLAVSSLPVYMVTGSPRTPHQEATAREGEHKDVTTASVGCGASVRSTLQFGSMPVINIYPSLLSEAEADHDLASLRRDKLCSPCPEQFTYAQEIGGGSAPATPATARTREGVVAEVAVATAMRLPPFSEDKTAARRTALDDGNSGSDGGGGGGDGAGSDGRKDSTVPVDTAGGARPMRTMTAVERAAFRSDGKGDEHLVGGGANSSRAWYSEPYYRVSHAELASYYGVNHAEMASSRKRLLDTDGDGSNLDGLVASARRGGGIVFHGRRGGGFGMETDSRFTEGRAGCSRMNKRVKADICGGGAQGNGGSSSGGDGTKSDDSGGGGGGGIPIVSCSDNTSGDSISGNSSSGSGSGGGSGGGSSGGGNASAKPPSRDSSIGEKRKRRDDDDGNEVICGSQGYDVKTAPGYDGDHEDCVGVRAAGGRDGVFRRTRRSRGQNKRSRSIMVS